MAELNKHHRQALIDELSKKRERLSRYKENINDPNCTKHEGLRESLEMQIFLTENSINLIEKSIIDNDADF